MDYASLPAKDIERYARTIQPGAWAIETQQPLSTLLGSCVAVCLFDPQLKIGGLNHFMLPDMGRSKHGDVVSMLSGNFAMEALLNALLTKGVESIGLVIGNKEFSADDLDTLLGGVSLRNTELTFSGCATKTTSRS